MFSAFLPLYLGSYVELPLFSHPPLTANNISNGHILNEKKTAEAYIYLLNT